MFTKQQKRLFAIRSNYAKKSALTKGVVPSKPLPNEREYFNQKQKEWPPERIYLDRTPKREPMKKFIFEGFNANCDCFNVIAYGKDAKSAAKNASKILSKKCGYRGDITVGDIPQKHINSDLHCYYEVGPKGEVTDGFGN